MGVLSTVETVLGWAEYFIIIVAAAEMIIAGWRASHGEIREGFNKTFWAIAGVAAMLTIVNLAVNSISLGPLNSLPGSNYIYALGVLAVGVGAVYGGYLLVKNELEQGMEMMMIAIIIAILMSSASSLFPGAAQQLQQIIDQGQQVSFNNLFYLITALPNQNAPGWGAVDQVFNEIQPLAEALLIVAFAVLAAWKFLFEGESELFNYLSSVLKDLAIALIVIFGAVDLYNMFADIVNGIAYYLGNNMGGINFINDALGGTVAFAATAAATGYFVPYIADFVGNITDVILFAIDLAALRYAVVAMLAAFAPLFAVLYLFPPTRKIAHYALDIFIGMSLGGLIAGAAAVMMNAVIGNIVNISIAGNNIADIFLGPIMMAIIPYIVPLFTLTGGGGFFGGGRGGRGSSSSSSTSNSAQSSTGSGTTSTTILVKQQPRSVGLLKRVRERAEQTVTLKPTEQAPEKLPGGLKKVDEYVKPVDQQKVKQYGQEVGWVASNAPPVPGIQQDISKYAEKRARELGIHRDQREKVAKYKESIPHAILSGMKENFLANLPVMLGTVANRIDNYLESRFGVRPAEPAVNKINEVILKRYQKQPSQTK